MKIDLRLGLSASKALGVVLLTGYVIMLAANAPGHLSYDSLIQLHEGRNQVRESIGPALYAWVLGAFDRLIPGTGLYLAFSGFLVTGSLLSLRSLRRQVSWGAVILAAMMVLTPNLLIYQGVVWKDVFFANLALAGFACLAQAVSAWDGPRRPWWALAGALLAFAAAAQVRQNGLIAPLFGALALAWVAYGRGRWRSSFVWGAGGLMATLALSALMGVLAQPPQAGPDMAGARGLRILAHYDIVGASAIKPTLPLDVIRHHDPVAEQLIRHRGSALYTPVRMDYLGQDNELGLALWALPNEVVFAQWSAILTQHPDAYLKHRWDVFRWVFATPKIDSCLPVYVGVAGPETLTTGLGIAPLMEPSDQALFNYSTWFLDTPLFSHVFFALVALVSAGVLLWRRESADVVIAAMLLSALAFAASFAVISIACDYRYLYYLDLAAMAGLLYLALDPPYGRLRRRLRWSRRETAP
ncbi:MAG: hypothetical protein Q8L59_13960 [Phenylobacterium sp.]|uniref:hypothetical protein n=1 Tax=Phenylobacterium sp. TaxID=1871053 RepID=UPI0027370BB5|nr:hypothetical protein [Phenylobacterium sp.]MDP1643276.1 hypothetical protein [Phenylobacterium sp.]MDP3116230.1 hypothetical protein [Phenylobacterium sp.]